MAYLVTLREEPKIDFAPATVEEEVIQNVRTLVSTVTCSIPLDRAFGIDGNVVDMPIQKAMAKMSQEIFMKIRRYEPRAIVEKITFDGEESGRLMPTIEVSIHETD